MSVTKYLKSNLRKENVIFCALFMGCIKMGKDLWWDQILSVGQGQLENDLLSENTISEYY